MSEILFIFIVGLSGVFLSMAVLFGSIRFTALVIDALETKEEKKND